MISSLITADSKWNNAEITMLQNISIRVNMTICHYTPYYDLVTLAKVDWCKTISNEKGRGIFAFGGQNSILILLQYNSLDYKHHKKIVKKLHKYQGIRNIKDSNIIYNETITITIKVAKKIGSPSEDSVCWIVP